MSVTEKYKLLYKLISLPNGVKLNILFAVLLMIINSSTEEGYVTEEELAYAERRAHAAPIQITGAAYIEDYGQLFEYGFSIKEDKTIEGLKKLATTMKKDGAKAIIQLTHAGRFSK